MVTKTIGYLGDWFLKRLLSKATQADFKACYWGSNWFLRWLVV